MANTLKIKRGTAATIPQGQLAEPLFTTDTYDLYIGKGSGGNQRFQKYIASGTSSQFLKGDGSLDSTTYQATSEKGQNNGYASLDAGGKIPVSQLPSSVIEYKGTWNASTNTPTLADGTGDAGDVYIVSVGGTQNLGSGSITFAAGDWVMYNGSVWQKSTGSNAVASVNGQTGIVVLDTDDISEPISATNLWFTNARARTAISLTTTGSSGMATYDNMTGVLNVPNYSISGLGGVPTSRTLTINGTAFDLSADRTWSVGTVTSVAALTIGTTGTDITSTVANGTTTPVITLNIPTASATNRGALSSADWSTFNGKQAQLNGTGFVKATGTTISYDNTSYLSLGGGTMSGQIVLAAGTTSTDYTKGLRFPNDPYGGGGDTSGLRLYADTGVGAEAQVLELYVTNDGPGGSQDRINFSAPSNNLVTINGNSIALNSSLSNYLPLTGGTLTGALSGTSSTMSSTSTATAFIPTGSTIPTNGMYLPSANTVAFAANSTRVIQISDSGRVSIGATTPTADTLTVHGAITTTNGGKITAQGMIEAGSTIFGGLNCIIVSDLSAASITPTGSTSPVNGMYLPSANTIAFSTLASPRMTITNGGLVRIGTISNSTNNILEAHQNNIRITAQSNGNDTAGFFMRTMNGATQTGNVTMRVNNSGSFQLYTGTTSDALQMTIASTGAATFSSTITTGTGNGTFIKYGDTGYLGQFSNGAYIIGGAEFNSSGTWTARSTAASAIAVNEVNAGTIVFLTNSGLTSGNNFTPSPRMTITSGGAVQITNNLTANSPSGGNTGEGIIAGRSFKLDASGSGQTAKMFVVSNTLSDTYGSGLQIQFANLADTLGFGFNLNTSGGYETYMKSGGSWNRAMTITSGGNVGIGTPSPNSVLEVKASGATNSIRLGSIAADATYNGVFLNGSIAEGVALGLAGGGGSDTSLYIQSGNAGSMIFRTGNGTNYSTRMTITSGGNVQIGTVSSSDSLTISKSTYPQIRLVETTTSPNATAIFGYDSPSAEWRIRSVTNHPLTFGTNDTERMRITSGGQVQIKQGSNSFSEGLTLTNTLNNNWTFVNGGDNWLYLGFNSSGRGYFNSSTGQYVPTSDINKKKDFEQSNIGLDAVLGLKPTLYRMKTEGEDADKHLGFIAQEVKEFIPQAYNESINADNVFIGLTEMPIIAALTKAIQEQQAQIEELKSKLA